MIAVKWDRSNGVFYQWHKICIDHFFIHEAFARYSHKYKRAPTAIIIHNTHESRMGNFFYSFEIPTMVRKNCLRLKKLERGGKGDIRFTVFFSLILIMFGLVWFWVLFLVFTLNEYYMSIEWVCVCMCECFCSRCMTISFVVVTIFSSFFARFIGSVAL